MGAVKSLCLSSFRSDWVICFKNSYFTPTVNCLIHDLYGCSASSNPGELWGRKKNVVCQKQGWRLNFNAFAPWITVKVWPPCCSANSAQQLASERLISWETCRLTAAGWTQLQFGPHRRKGNCPKTSEHLYKKSHKVLGQKKALWNILKPYFDFYPLTFFPLWTWEVILKPFLLNWFGKILLWDDAHLIYTQHASRKSITEAKVDKTFRAGSVQTSNKTRCSLNNLTL